jgi:hypothetical protein
MPFTVPQHSRAYRVAPRLLACALLLVASSCGGGRSLAGGDPFSGAGTATEARVRVRNQNFYDATLTAISDQGRRRLGSVGGNSTAVFTMPWSFTSGLRIQIDLLAGPTCTTDVIQVNPGDVVEMDIMPDLTSGGFCR